MTDQFAPGQAPGQETLATGSELTGDPDAALPAPELGGETACWAHLVCPECGAMVSEGHLGGCESRPGGRPGEAGRRP